MKKLMILPLCFLILLSGCLKLEDKKAKPEEALISQTQDSAKIENKNLTNAPLRLCQRPAHFVGLKKCVRSGKWIRMSLNSRDVDNDRMDVFTEPGMSLAKENFYPDTFRIEQGIKQVTNYPDQYRTNSAYGGEAFFIFAMPSQQDLALSYTYWGRDESFSEKVLFSQIPGFGTRYVKVQHWNDGHAFKKHAQLQIQIIGDYQEVNYRQQCAWMESDQGFDYTQEKTKEGIANIKVPETLVWRKITEKCETIPNKFQNPEYSYLPFSEISTQQALPHSFKNELKYIKRLYPKNKEIFENEDYPFEIVNPLAKFPVKRDGSTPILKNYRGEEISKIEGIYDEDLKDKSFNPQIEKTN